jgi:hypothetical protein
MKLKIILLIATVFLSTTTAAVLKSAEIKQAEDYLLNLFPDSQKGVCHEHIKKEIVMWKIDVADTLDPLDVKITYDILKPFIDEVKPHIEEVTGCADENIYLRNAMLAAKSDFISDFKDVDSQNAMKFYAKRSVCHSIFIKALMSYCYQDFDRAGRLFKKVIKLLKNSAKFNFFSISIFKSFGAFQNIKANTVLIMLQKNLDTFFTKQQVQPKDKEICGVRFNNISVNIAEAMYYDNKAEHKDNAYAGAVMVVTPAVDEDSPRLEATTPRYHANPAIYKIFQPFPKKWADLYSVWNMAFTAREFPNFPHYWAKLLTPYVGCSNRIPGGYIFHRAVALTMHIIHNVLKGANDESDDEEIDARLPRFTLNFGRTNKMSAVEYYNLVQSKDTKESAMSRESKFEKTIYVIEKPKSWFGKIGDFAKSLFNVIPVCFDEDE